MGTTPDEALARIARQASGIFTRADAVAAGVSPGEIRDRLRSGLWVAPLRGVLRAATTPDSIDGRERAALARIGDGAVLSHLSAARRYGLSVPASPQVWVTVPAGRSPRCPPGVRLIRSRHVPPAAIRQVGGFPLLNPARTVADLAVCLEERALVAVALEALQRRLCTHAELGFWQQCLAGRAGTAALTKVLQEADPALESILAAEFGQLMTGAGILLVPGYRLRLPDGSVVLCDFADPDARIDFEIDGFAFHSSRQQIMNDRARDRRLLRADWITVRYVTDDVRCRPAETVADAGRQLEFRRQLR